MASGTMVVPMVLWGQQAPTHCISAIIMTPDLKHLISGCNDGQICIWDVADDWQVCPRSLLFGHSAAISCLAMATCSQSDQQLVVSSSESGEMCLWDVSDGRCIESTKMSAVHTDIIAYPFRSSNSIRLLCNGYYPEVLVLDPHTFEVVHSLCSQVAPDWISACCHILPPNRQDDVILAISNSGAVKVWTLGPGECKVKMEDESKQIRCLNAQTLTCCPFNQRTVLIVCSKYWQVYNFEQLCGRTIQGVIIQRVIMEEMERKPEIYDASDFTLLCSESNRCGERWAGGDFLSLDRVVVWSTEGRGYLYKLPTNANPDSTEYHRSHHNSTVHAYYVLDVYSSQSPSCTPALSFFRGKGDKQMSGLLVRGDSEGRLVVWQIPEVSEKQMTLVRQESFDRLPALLPKLCTTLQDVWNTNQSLSPGVLDGLCDQQDGPLKITATIYVPSQGKLVCGRDNGSIVIVPALAAIAKQLLGDHSQEIPIKILSGHVGRVTCLLYPFNDCTRYEPQHLLSGGLDFSVILWDINTGSRIHTFTIHGGMLEQLIVPPTTCNPRILSSVCSVASDHSVALLSLKERKCIMLAGRHLFPVKAIRWRPIDDFLLVCCTDGTVYVWQMETGHLDRVVHGITAEDIMSNCDENALPKETLTNPSLTLVQALKRRNLATFRNLAQQKLQQQVSQQASSQGPKAEFIRPTGFPLLVQGVRTNTKDPDAHVLFFDTESLIVQLLSEEFSLLSPQELEARGLSAITDKAGDGIDPQQKLIGFLAKAKETVETVGQKVQTKAEPGTGSSSPAASKSPQHARQVSAEPGGHESMVMDIARLLISCLHAWGLDPDLDRLCSNKLGLLRPVCPISFGLLSYQGHMSLMLPGWQGTSGKTLTGAALPPSTKKRMAPPPPGMQALDAAAGGASLLATPVSPTTPEEPATPRPTLLAQRMGSVPFDEAAGSVSENGNRSPLGPLTPKPVTPTSAGPCFPAPEELLEYVTKVRWQISSAITTQHLLSVISIANTLMSMSRATFLPPVPLPLSGDSRREGLDTQMLHLTDDEENEAAMLQQSQIKQGWSLLAALHCVLLPELIGVDNYRSPQLEMLARRWQDRCLEIREAAQALLLAELRRIGAAGRKAVIDEWAPYLPTRVDPKISILSEGGKEEEDDEEEVDQMLGGDLMSKMSVSFENRRKQATAIVMLGVIGAEFGQEIEPSRIRKPDDSKKSKSGKSQEGFNLSNHSLARQTSRALTFLLLSPPSPKLPAFTPLRRAAIDLLGRGFTVWEPYLDISSVLMGLLELCVDAEKRVPSMTFGLPLSPASDACRTARHALSLIATARPPAFIITMAKEVARYNAMAQNAQSQHTQLHNMALVRAAPEIMHVIEMLVEKMPNDVADLLIEVMDISMHCLDLNMLKQRGLQELFPAICRFSMVSFCTISKRLWVGAKSGALCLYEMKQHSKPQLIHAHNGPVVAVAVNPDGKYLATFSPTDQRLKIFQTATSSLFNLGSQPTRCTRQYTTKEINMNNVTNILKLVRLVWIDPRTVVLLTADGSETKFSV